jgi:hypothetical protein
MDTQGGVDGEMKMRLEKAKAPFLAKVDEAQAALDAALEARKPSEELAKLLTAYSDATEQTTLLRTNNDYNQNRDYTNSLTGTVWPSQSSPPSRKRTMPPRCSKSALPIFLGMVAAPQSWDSDQELAERAGSRAGQDAQGANDLMADPDR